MAHETLRLTETDPGHHTETDPGHHTLSFSNTQWLRSRLGAAFSGAQWSCRVPERPFRAPKWLPCMKYLCS